MANYIDAADYGFLPGALPGDNVKALQSAIERGGTIQVDVPGVYDLDGTIRIGSDTALECGAGVYFRRVKKDGDDFSYSFVNKGAFTRTYDRNIRIQGLRLICGGVDVGTDLILGLRSHLAFFYVKKLVIRDFECLDLLSRGFCIQVCTFEDLLVENAHIEGKKDAVHLGRGSKFAIRHGIFRTYADPIALNAHDYATSNPQLGWIEDGIIEDCYDLDQEKTDGFFCRILAGSWSDWHKGMAVQHSDPVVCGGRLYRVAMRPDGANYISETPPSHLEGRAEYDGITWAMVQDDACYECGCRNIHFRDIFLQKKRPYAFSIHFDNDNWSRSVYPGSIMPMQRDLIFENIFFSSEIPCLILAATPVNNIKLVNSVLQNSRIELTSLPYMRDAYVKTDILLSGTTFRGIGGNLVVCDAGRTATLKVLGSIVEDDAAVFAVKGAVRTIAADIPLAQ